MFPQIRNIFQTQMGPDPPRIIEQRCSRVISHKIAK